MITGPKAEGRLNLARAIPLMADGRMNLKPIITHTFSLDEINTAFERMERSDVRYRFVIDMASLTA